MKSVFRSSIFLTLGLAGVQGLANTCEYSFPKTATSQFVHGLCTKNAGTVFAYSTDKDLTYSDGGTFQTGTKLWGDRGYKAAGIKGPEMCDGGDYLIPSRHKSIDKGTVVQVTSTSKSFELCTMIESNHLYRDGDWEIELPKQGFSVSNEFNWEGRSEKMKVYCKQITCGAPQPSSSGDPHFVTFGGEKYDFHGGCDLVLLQNAGFNHGLGMNIHIRTAIRTWWSYIESAILQIGENTLQITGGMKGSTYSINGAPMSALVTGDAVLGDYAIHFRQVNEHQTQTRIDLGNHGDAIGIETFKNFVRVNVKDEKKTSFEGASGLLGSYPDGKKVGRDGTTVFENPNEFGQEWMVKPIDNILFSDVDIGQLPLQCAMPQESMKEGRRRLGESGITEEEAALACARVSEFDRDACVFDVLATNDKDMVGSY